MEVRAVEPAARPRYRVEALAKGLRVLREFTDRTPRLRMAEISDRTGLPLPTLVRILATLEEEGFVERLPDGSYRPDVAVLTLGYSALQGLDVVEAASTSLRALAERTGETVNLGTLSGDRVLYLQRIRNAELVTASINVGSTLPAVATSMGKLLLAQLRPEELDARLTPASFEGGAGPNALRTRNALDRQLDLIRSRGYALQDQEVASNLRSIAGPVRDGSGAVIAAVNVAVQATGYDVERILAELKDPVLEACRQISLRLGSR